MDSNSEHDDITAARFWRVSANHSESYCGSTSNSTIEATARLIKTAESIHGSSTSRLVTSRLTNPIVRDDDMDTVVENIEDIEHLEDVNT